jgi:hypothetical protein
VAKSETKDRLDQCFWDVGDSHQGKCGMWSDCAERVSERGSPLSGDLFREPQTCVSPRTKGRCPVCQSLAAYECAYCIMPPSSSSCFGYLRTSFHRRSWYDGLAIRGVPALARSCVSTEEQCCNGEGVGVRCLRKQN